VRHASEGEFRAREGNEIEDGFDAVQWCAELQGSSGDVGMYGMSYGGYTQLAAAGARPPALRCISPGCARAAAGDIMVAGLPRLAFAVSWCLGMAWDEAQRRGERADALRLWEASGRFRPCSPTGRSSTLQPCSSLRSTSRRCAIG
jgi:uncharacterized protein